MNKVILDASALIALIQEEPGAEVVRPLLKSSIMSSINIAEALTVLQRIGIQTNEARMLISDVIGNIISFDLDQAQKVAELQPLTQAQGLSLGDRACIALGLHFNCPIYTAAKIWSKLDIDCDIKIIR